MLEQIITRAKDFCQSKGKSIISSSLIKIAIPLAVGFFYVAPILESRIQKEEQYQPVYNTLAHEVLRMESEFGTTMDDFKLLDSIISDAKDKIEVKKEYSDEDVIKIFKTISSILEEHEISYEVGNLFNEGLKNRTLDCDRYSFIYKSIGDELGLPLHIVYVPDHAFIRWDSDGIHDPINDDNPVNKGDLNWETTSSTLTGNRNYTAFYSLFDDDIILKGNYLQNLTKDNIYALIHGILGNTHFNNNNLEKSIESYTRGIELNPNMDVLYYNRGIVLGELNRYEEAIKDFQKVISLYPEHKEAYIFLGLNYESIGDIDKSLNYFQTALMKSINRESEIKLHSKLSNLYEMKGDLVSLLKSRMNIIKLIEFEPDNPNNYLRRVEINKKINELEPHKENISFNLKSIEEDYKIYEDLVGK
jgi:Tfp pilus assembly protein PilF